MTIKEAMESNIVTFSFTKVSTKSHRHARGTRDLNLIPKENHPKGTGKPPKEGLLVFFDMDKNAWRSCLESKIFGTWNISEKDLIHRIDTYEKLGIK